MASRKRYIDADMFQDEWFVDLEPKYKLAWVYLLTNCGHDGLWKVSQKLLTFNVGEHIEIVGLKRSLGDRVVEIEGGKMWFIPKFIYFQYGDVLSTKNNALKQFFEAYEKYNLENFVNITIIDEPLKRGKGAPSEGHLRGAKDMVIVKDKDKDKENDLPKVNKLFITTWGRNPKNFSEILAVEKLMVDYSEKHIVQAFRRAGEMDKMTVAYVKGILKNHYEKMAVSKERKQAMKKKLEAQGIDTKGTVQIN